METVKKTLIGLRDALLMSLFITTAVVIIINVSFNYKPKVQEVLKQTFYYHVADGQNGITCFTMNTDSTISIEYILDGVVYSANHIDSTQYRSTMSKVYNTGS